MLYSALQIVLGCLSAIRNFISTVNNNNTFQLSQNSPMIITKFI